MLKITKYYPHFLFRFSGGGALWSPKTLKIIYLLGNQNFIIFQTIRIGIRIQIQETIEKQRKFQTPKFFLPSFSFQVFQGAPRSPKTLKIIYLLGNQSFILFQTIRIGIGIQIQETIEKQGNFQTQIFFYPHFLLRFSGGPLGAPKPSKSYIY